MKHLLLGILLAYGLCSCEQHIGMLTQIYPDGSCMRSIQLISSDSAFLTGDTTANPFPFSLRSEWEIMVYDSTSQQARPWPLQTWDTGSVTLVASHRFASVSEMNANFRLDNSPWKLTKAESCLRKSFRWFYTYYSFSEKYIQLPSDQLSVSLDHYLTKDEQKLWFQGNLLTYEGMNGKEIYDHLDKIEAKADNWSDHVLYALEYSTIEEAVRSLQPNPFVARLAAARDSIYTRYQDRIKKMETIYPILDEYFQTTYFSDLNREHARMLDSLGDVKLQSLDLFGLQFKYELIMPGEVVSDNAPVRKGNKLTWKLDAYRLLPADYILTAESRRLNTWALAVTVFIVGVMLWYVFRKPRED